MAQEEAEISILVRVVEGLYQRAQGVVAQFCLILLMVQEEAGLWTETAHAGVEQWNMACITVPVVGGILITYMVPVEVEG